MSSERPPFELMAQEFEELRACVYAAADGHPELAERYVAAGALGVRQLEGDWACAFESLQPVGAGASIQINTQAPRLVRVRRLWVDPRCAASFALSGVAVDNLLVFGVTAGDTQGALPARVFSRHYGSPLLDAWVRPRGTISLTAHNQSERPAFFRAVAFGHTEGFGLGL